MEHMLHQSRERTNYREGAHIKQEQGGGRGGKWRVDKKKEVYWHEFM